ncbi:acyl-CoA synthetase [Mycobacterium eburneum]|nr:AMP-binding protein [Mycobacterium eburneum]TDH57688.1 acyl-CoA synthetase [Mycobacterium eburneum]
MTDTSLTGVLRERASLQPDDDAFTYIDYDHDWDGVAQTLTWAQLYRRVLSLADELRGHAVSGDRAVIVAPQGLEYVVAFLGSLQAGLIAVPLSVPMGGATDERVSAVLRDASPTVLLTTSSAAGVVADYAVPAEGGPAPAVIAVDSLDLDTRRRSTGKREAPPATAYLQYTSGSTRTPAGVMISNANLTANFRQMMCDFFPEYGKVAPPDTTVVSWLPFYHDMGLMLGVCGPILGGWRTVIMSPVSFLQRPARWMQAVARHPRVMTAAPNFAFDLAAGRTSDDDMAELDLGDVLAIYSGAERVQVSTLRRFAQRFAKFNLREEVIRPSYGLAEATLYVATGGSGRPPKVVHFEPEKLSAGHAKRCAADDGTPLVSYGTPHSPAVRIVDPETGTECPAGAVGEIWALGDNISAGYWHKPAETEQTFGGQLPGAPDGRWLRTGDLGFISEDELFIIGRIKDVLIVRGRNHYPDDIEATVQPISKGRVAAIAVPDGDTETLVVIVEIKKRSDSDDEWAQRLERVKNDVVSAISTSHGLSAADVVLVGPGSIPITTSGKIRRAACVELYRDGQFTRVDG